MSASLHLFSLTPKTLSLHHTSSSTANPSLFTTISPKPLPKLVLSFSSVNKSAQTASRFIRNVAISSEVEEGEESLDFSGSEERSFSPDLKLFVGNLSFNVDSSALAGLFEQAGNVEMVEVIYDKLSGRSRGFGFVTMSTIEEVEAAAQQFNGYELQGRALRVNYGPAPPKENSFRNNSSFRDNSSYRDNSSSRGPPRGGGRSESSSGNRVYVGNLAYGVDNLTLENLFGKQGRVQEARVIYDRESGRSKGFGFVTFSSAEEVNSAVESLDGMDLDGRTIRVSPAEDRPRRQF